MQGGRASPNPAFAQEPNCVLCQPKPALVEQRDLTVNPALKCGFISTTQMNGLEYFGRYGITPFFVRTEGGRQDFIRFTFFILEAMSNTLYASYQINVDKTTTGERGKPAPQPQILGPFPPKTQSITPFALPL